MRTLVLGGIRSGKSRWAEARIQTAGEQVRYIATADYATGDTGTGEGATRHDDDGDGEDRSWQRRIAEHRRRRPPQWTTVETTDLAGELRRDPRGPTLVDDLGGWLTGHLDRLGWSSEPTGPAVEELLAAIAAVRGPLIMVSPEVGLSVVPATAAGTRFADELGTLNQRVAGACEQVVLIVAGQPIWVKR